MILNIIIVVLSFCMQLSNALVFDYYTGKIASKQLIAYYKSKGILDVCTTDIKPCCATERRRLDGSCNCLHSPTKGTYFVPLTRVLPALYYNGSYPRKAESGKELLWPRIIRRVLLAEGKASDCHFTQAMTSYGIFMFSDFGSIHDILQSTTTLPTPLRYSLQYSNRGVGRVVVDCTILNYLINKTDCCTKQGKKDYMCTPNFVPNEDSLNRLGHVTCLNLTRPLTHQDFGCSNDSIPSPVVLATSTFDLSHIYNFHNRGEKAIRAYHDGLIIMEVENGKTWPQNGPGLCPLNKPDETRCFVNHPNILVIQELFVVWFLRLHNYFATQLAIVNPCWDDDQLFYVARDMNIAYAMQMYLYEWLASLAGYHNLVKSGVISKNPGFRNIHDPTKCPSTTLEFTYVIRWFHLAQDATAKLYDEHGHYLRDFPMFNLTTRTGFLVKYKRMEEFTQGHFRQPSGKINDRTIDHEVADNGLAGGLQYALDITTSDLHKNRLFGLRPYIDYVHYCTGHKITCFDDLRKHIDPCKIKELKKLYEHVRDVDLMAGMWCEKRLKGGWIPPTLACLLNDNLLKAIKGDRHWYENEHRPYPFTKGQLLEMRKASLAWLLCTVGDGVTKVQRHAFLTISPKNPLLKCRKIPGIDFEAWADPACSCTCHKYEF